MSTAYYPSDQQVMSRSLKVQKVSIPFVIVGNATSTSVTSSNDEPSLLFIKTEGLNQITAALASNETATYSVAADDSDGIFNILVRIFEPVGKLISVHAHDRLTGLLHPCKLGSSTGITTGSGGGQSMMITCDSAIDLSGANTINACLELEYSVDEQS